MTNSLTFYRDEAQIETEQAKADKASNGDATKTNHANMQSRRKAPCQGCADQDCRNNEQPLVTDESTGGSPSDYHA